MKTRYTEPKAKLLCLECEQPLAVSKKNEYSPNPSHAKELPTGDGELKSTHSVWDE